MIPAGPMPRAVSLYPRAVFESGLLDKGTELGGVPRACRQTMKKPETTTTGGNGAQLLKAHINIP